MTDICKSPDRLRQTVTCPGFVYVYAFMYMRRMGAGNRISFMGKPWYNAVQSYVKTERRGRNEFF